MFPPLNCIFLFYKCIDHITILNIAEYFHVDPFRICIIGLLNFVYVFWFLLLTEAVVIDAILFHAKTFFYWKRLKVINFQSYTLYMSLLNMLDDNVGVIR